MPKSRLDDKAQTEVFAHELCGICGSFDVEQGALPSKGSAVCERKAGLDLAIVDQNARAIHRRDRNIKRDPGNHFFLVLQDVGHAVMQQDDQTGELVKGDMYLVDSTRPSSFHYKGQRSRQISLHLPRDETVARFGKRIAGGMHIHGQDPLAQAMQAILTELVQGKSPAYGQTAEAFHSVLGAYLFSRSQGQKSQFSQDRQIINRALSIIHQHCGDPDFSPHNLAELAGVSLRRLQRAFALLNTSPHRRIQEVRLETACDQLRRTSDFSNRSITGIAFDSGYRDLSTFYRHFRSRFGCTPKDWRALQ